MNGQRKGYRLVGLQVRRGYSTRDSELSDYVVSKGGKMSETFNKDVTILIVPTKDTTSSKVDKAKKWGIPIITLSEAKQYIDEHF